MAQVVTRCRFTGHYLFMGIDIAPEQLPTLPNIFSRKFCPFCACEHEWLKKDSKLLDSRRTVRLDIQRAL